MTKSLIFSLITLALALTSSALHAPYVQFFDINTCGGPSKYTFESIPNFNQNPIGNNVRAVTGRGMWYLTYQNTSNPGVIATSYILQQGSLDTICHIFSSEHRLISLERVFDVELEESAIALFPDVAFYHAGLRVVANSDQFSLVSPITVNSYAFTGVRNWTVFTQPDFKGTSRCLQVKNEGLELGYQITEQPVVTPPLIVGSGRVGCPGDKPKYLSIEERIKSDESGSEPGVFVSVVDSAKDEVYL